MRIKFLLFGFLLFFINNAQAQEIKMLANLSQMLGTSDYRLMESVEMGGNLYFTTWSKKGTELWQTNGRSTSLIYQWAQATFPSEYAVNKLYAYNNQLLFTGMDSAHGKELWTSDGTSAGTHLLKDLNPGVKSGFDPTPRRIVTDKPNNNFTPFANVNGKMCFMARDAADNNQLWITDGSVQGTVALAPFSSYPTFGLTSEVGVLKQNFFLGAASSSFNFATYLSDGTAAGTSLLTDKSLFQDYFEFQGKLFFNKTGNQGFWCSDGTQAGTISLVTGIVCSADKLIFNNQLYFFNSGSFGEFYTSDGTPNGTSEILNYTNTPGMPANLPRMNNQRSFPVVFKSYIYFCGLDELWKSDGTTAGTQYFDFRGPGQVMYASPVALIVAGEHMFFKAWDSIRVDLFVSDGTSAGTKKIGMAGTNYFETAFVQGDAATAQFPNENMIVFGKRLLFTEVYDTSVGKALYMIDVAPLSVPPTAAEREELLVSPNPATSSLSIRYPENQFEQASVVDVMGRNVYQQAVSKKGNDVLNLLELAPGQYFVRLSGNGHSVSAPVIINR